MAATGGTRTIVTALIANFTISIAKFFGFVITSSSAMLAEAVHSLADTSNQALLLLGKSALEITFSRTAIRIRTGTIFWAFVVSIVLSFAGFNVRRL